MKNPSHLWRCLLGNKITSLFEGGSTLPPMMIRQLFAPGVDLPLVCHLCSFNWRG
jgi:hypothetical protein